MAIWMSALLCFLAGALLAPGADRKLVSADLLLVGVAHLDGAFYASVVDKRTDEHFLLSAGVSEYSVKLVSITSAYDAIVEQDGQSTVLRLGWDSSSPLPDASNRAASASSISSISHPAALPTPPPGESLPLVFQALDPRKIQLTEEQQAIVSQLRQKFLGAIGGSNSGVSPATTATNVGNAPADTQNAVTSSNQAVRRTQVWQTAQEQNDAEFKMLFGVQAFNLYQMGLASHP